MQQIHEAFGAQILIYAITTTCPDQFVVILTHHETSTIKCAHVQLTCLAYAVGYDNFARGNVTVAVLEFMGVANEDVVHLWPGCGVRVLVLVLWQQ
jgi:hypothetical protein